ncbi:MAG: hypothetical protein AB8G86_29420 [Saprospiraceae bacterium]
MKTLSNLLFFGLLLLGFTSNAQNVDLSLRFNVTAGTYEIYAKPDFTKGEFLMGAGSQVTVVLPADFQDKPLTTTGSLENKWIDESPIYAPTQQPKSDFHTFVIQGGTFDFRANEETKLFEFALPLSYDHKEIRLLVNNLDNNIKGRNGAKKIENYIANDVSLTDFYRSNYAIIKDIKGHIKDWRGYPMEGTEIIVGNKSFTALYDGRFEFMDISVPEKTTFKLQKTIEAKAGISTADLIRLQQHLTGEKIFDQAYQWVAADLDNSGQITYADLAILKKVINGGIKEAGWRFLPTDLLNKLANTSQEIPTTSTQLTAERVYAIEFTGIKMGDINGSYTLDPKTPNDVFPSAKTLTINLLNADLKAGQNYIVPFSTNDFGHLSAYQMTLKIENANITQLENTFKKQPGLSLRQLPKDLIVANWLNDKISNAVLVKNKKQQSGHQAETAILELEIIPQKDGLLSDFITLMDNPVRTEAYDTEGKVMPLQLLFRRAPAEEGKLELYQNRPNPFLESTNISYFLPKDGPIILTLTNEAGQVIKVLKNTGTKGFNAFRLVGSEVPKGLIYYQLETEFGTETKKMLHLN